MSLVKDKLEEILTSRKVQLQKAKAQVSLDQLEKKAKVQSPADFFAAISRPDRIAVIAEMKEKSPSAGIIRRRYDVDEISEAYEQGGAAALSVLTEQVFFGGDIADLSTAHAASSLPILRKDFIFDPYQVVEAKAAGASAVLLIADMVPASLLKELAVCAKENGMAALVEIFNAGALPDALATGSKIIGINTRNLRTLEMTPGRVATLAKEIPSDCVLVAESGIKTADDMQKLKQLRVSAALVGESLLRQEDLVEAVRALAEAGKR